MGGLTAARVYFRTVWGRQLKGLCGLLVLLFGFALSAAAQTFSGPQSWRSIDVLVDLPQDFTTNPTDGDFYSEEELEAEVQALFASVNEYFQPLKLQLRPSTIQMARANDEDPYQASFDKRNAYDVLKIAAQRWAGSDAPAHQLVVVLGRRNFNGQSGLDYPGVYCVVPKYCVVFAATQGGRAPHISMFWSRPWPMKSATSSACPTTPRVMPKGFR